MARSFNGSTQYLLTSSNPSGVTAPWSFSLWLMSSSFAGTNRLPFIIGNVDASAVGIGFINLGGNVLYYFNSAFNPTVFTLSTNTWYSIIGVLSGVVFTLYVNGVADTNTVSTAVPSAGHLSLGMGWGNTNNYDFMPCSVADVAVWNVALTAGEIAGLANGIRPIQVRPRALTIWLPLDGIESPEPDLSGFALNGALTASPTLAPGPPVTMFTPRWVSPILPAPPPPTFVLMSQACL